MIITIDGIKTELRSPDLDGDGETGGVEQLRPQTGIVPVMQQSELGETIKEIYADEVDPRTRMTSIDLRTRIQSYFERNAMIGIDSATSLKLLPLECSVITRHAKRLNVSLMGKGRQEAVDIIAGQREHVKNSMGLGDKIRNFVGMKPKDES
jgi:hypothetical protein